VRLLKGPASELLLDVILVAALTGARIDAVCSLRVKDCAEGFFLMRSMKRECQARRVPIHRELVPLVGRRCTEKQMTTISFMSAIGILETVRGPRLFQRHLLITGAGLELTTGLTGGVSPTSMLIHGEGGSLRRPSRRVWPAAGSVDTRLS
jgi:integrase